MSLLLLVSDSVLRSSVLRSHQSVIFRRDVWVSVNTADSFLYPTVLLFPVSLLYPTAIQPSTVTGCLAVYARAK